MKRAVLRRFGSEVVNLNEQGHSVITVVRRKTCGLQACIQFRKRKGNLRPDPLWKQCVCRLHGRELCGARILQNCFRSCEPNCALLPFISYQEALGFIKVMAFQLKLPNALKWGTHAFRRVAQSWHGLLRLASCLTWLSARVRQAMQQGGVSALHQIGGWRSVASLGYIMARTKACSPALEKELEESDSDKDRSLTAGVRAISPRPSG